MKYTRTNTKTKINISEEEWEKFCQNHPKFKFWNLILKLELLLLEFVKPPRSGNFQCYVETLKQATPQIFSLHHHNYTTQLPTHLTQMIYLKEIHQSLHEKLFDGKFTIKKINRAFPKIALHQNHEQLNACINSVGGATGLTENDAAL